METEWILIGILTVCIVAIVFTTIDATNDCKLIVDASDKLVMYDRNVSKVANGLYYPTEEYYTVWVKDRTVEEIATTEIHEQCHALIDRDYEHFCE